MPYERTGTRGMFQSMTEDLFQFRLAALDPDTGESLWDTQLSDQLGWEASVLAGGRRYAYVATDSGLAIVAMADGTVVAEGAGVAGVGDAYLAARSAYAYDPEGRRVLAMTGTGDVLAIPLDQTKAETGRRADSGRVVGPALLGTGAGGSSRRRRHRKRRWSPARTGWRCGKPLFAGLGQELVHVSADGLRISFPRFPRSTAPGLVVAGGAAVGVTSGHVLVEHQRSVNDSDMALSMARPDNGQVTTTLNVEHAVVRAVIGRTPPPPSPPARTSSWCVAASSPASTSARPISSADPPERYTP